MAPVIPTTDQVAAGTVADGQAKMTNMFSDLHIYQKQLKDYRSCLTTAMDADQAQAKTAKDAAASRSILDEFARYQTAFNASVDAESGVVKQIQADIKAHCARDHSDFCKPKS